MTEFQVVVYNGVNDSEEVLDDMLLEKVADSRHFCHLQLFKPLLLAPDVIIQAKHTNGVNMHFSDSDFFSEKASSAVVAKEIPRIQKLRKNGQLDHYILFSNRRLSGNTESMIRAHLAKQCKMPESSLYLCGIEQLERYLKIFPDVPRLADLNPLESPLIVSPDELSVVVERLAKQFDEVPSLSDDPPTARVPFDRKNRLNNMTAPFASEQLKRFLKETQQIKEFLSAPGNLELLRLYESTTDEFQFKIIAKREEHNTFDDVMNYLADLLFVRDPVLSANRRLTRAMLFYMYWNCDIGQVEDASTN